MDKTIIIGKESKTIVSLIVLLSWECQENCVSSFNKSNIY